MGEGGFEPPKQIATDLQSAPFGHSGILPYIKATAIWQIAFLWSWWTDLNPRPADYKSAALPTELHQHIQVTHLTLIYNTTSEHFCQHFFKIFIKKIYFFAFGSILCRSQRCLLQLSHKKPEQQTPLRPRVSLQFIYSYQTLTFIIEAIASSIDF